MGIQKKLMAALYGHDIWQDFRPAAAAAGEVHGWNGEHPSLSRLAGTPGPEKIIIDVGVWLGQSTITMANALRQNEIDGVIIAVDTFLGSVEHWDTDLFDRRHGLPDLYQRFLDNVYYAGLLEYIIPLPNTSACAARILTDRGVSASLVHIDAAHQYEDVLRDAEDYWGILCSGGFLIGDDYHETWPGVIRAAGEFSARRLLPLTIDPPKWIVQKP